MLAGCVQTTTPGFSILSLYNSITAVTDVGGQNKAEKASIRFGGFEQHALGFFSVFCSVGIT